VNLLYFWLFSKFPGKNLTGFENLSGLPTLFEKIIFLLLLISNLNKIFMAPFPKWRIQSSWKKPDRFSKPVRFTHRF
jgi:hypothetical protein